MVKIVIDTYIQLWMVFDKYITVRQPLRYITWKCQFTIWFDLMPRAKLLIMLKSEKQMHTRTRFVCRNLAKSVKNVYVSFVNSLCFGSSFSPAQDGDSNDIHPSWRVPKYKKYYEFRFLIAWTLSSPFSLQMFALLFMWLYLCASQNACFLCAYK